jgi:PAS domain S-box-containing protein
MEGISLQSIFFTPGNTVASDSSAYEIIKLFNIETRGKIPIFGGCASNNWKMESSSIFRGSSSYTDSLLIAVLETSLKTASSIDHGFIHSGATARVTGSKGHRVTAINGAPADEVIASMAGLPISALHGKHISLETSKPFGIIRDDGILSVSVASYFTPDRGVRFSQPVPEGAILTMMATDNDNLSSTGLKCAKAVLTRISSSAPACMIYLPCALRGRLKGHSLENEIAPLAETYPDAVLFGFLSFGEQGVCCHGLNIHSNMASTLLVICDELSDAAAAARERARFSEEAAGLVDMLTIHRNLSIELSSSDELIRSLAVIIYSICLLGEFDAGGAYLINDETGGLSLVYHYNLSEKFVENGKYYNPGSPQFDFVKKGQCVFMEYNDLLQTIDTGNDIQLLEGIKAIAVIPLFSGGRLIGALNIASKTTNVISPHSRTFLESISGYVSNVLRRNLDLNRLKKSQSNFLGLFTSVDDMIFIADFYGKIIDINEAVITKTGYCRDELMELNLLKLHPESMVDEVNSAIAAMIRGEKDLCVIPVVTKNGKEIPVETQISIGEWNGIQCIYGISRDTTERIMTENRLRLSLQEKELLLREVNHRVKNNMQLISSMISLQVASSEDMKSSAILTDIQHRIHTIALIHDLLYKSDNLARINVSEYIKNISGYLLSSLSIEAGKLCFETEGGENIFITATRAVPCGLIINELITNAIKYAAGPDRSVNIKSETASENGSIIIKISDRGPGLPDGLSFETGGSLGFTILRTLTRQLKGTLEFHYSGGLTAVLKFPESGEKNV